MTGEDEEFRQKLMETIIEDLGGEVTAERLGHILSGMKAVEEQFDSKILKITWRWEAGMLVGQAEHPRTGEQHAFKRIPLEVLERGKTK